MCGDDTWHVPRAASDHTHPRTEQFTLPSSQNLAWFCRFGWSGNVGCMSGLHEYSSEYHVKFDFQFLQLDQPAPCLPRTLGATAAWKVAQVGAAGAGPRVLQAPGRVINDHQNVLMSVPPLPPVLHPSYAAHRGTRDHYHKHAADLPSPAPKWSLLCLMGIFADKNQFNHIQPARLIRAQNCKTPNKERWMMVFSSLN